MALQTFYAGSFMVLSQLTEWDGSNHDEILDWINELDEWTTDPALSWRITAVSDRSFTLHKPADPNGWPPEREAVITRDDWVWASNAIFPDQLTVQPVAPAGKWKTSDPYGRPLSLDDITGGADG